MQSGSRPIEGAPPGGRRLLGVLLAQRRIERGWTHLPGFCRDRLPLTGKGNPNTRLAADLEKAYRDTFPEPRLRQLARAYEVTYESAVDVAWGRATALVPAAAAVVPLAAVPLAAVPLAAVPDAPIADRRREQADYPYVVPIWERILRLIDQGITSPSGVQLFPAGSADAMAWDGSGGRGMGLDDRAWLIADLQQQQCNAGGGTNTGTDGP